MLGCNMQVPDPEFEGQTKTRLGNPEVRKIVEGIVSQVRVLLYSHSSPVLNADQVTACVRQAAGGLLDSGCLLLAGSLTYFENCNLVPVLALPCWFSFNKYANLVTVSVSVFLCLSLSLGVCLCLCVCVLHAVSMVCQNFAGA